jgi:hypothetical protein
MLEAKYPSHQLSRRTLAPADVLPPTGVCKAPSPPSCANMQHQFQCCAVRIKFPSSATTCYVCEVYLSSPAFSMCNEDAYCKENKFTRIIHGLHEYVVDECLTLSYASFRSILMKWLSQVGGALV